MSKLYDKYLCLKKSHPSDNTLLLFKSGIFFIFLDKDAVIASEILSLKLTHFTETVLKCGFPINSLDKYSNILKHCNYEIIVVDSAENTLYEFIEFKANDKTLELIEELANINPENLSIKEAYDLLDTLKKKSLELKDMYIV